MIIQACSRLLLTLVDHRVLWDVKALGLSLLGALWINGHTNFKPTQLQTANIFLTSLFNEKL